MQRIYEIYEGFRDFNNGFYHAGYDSTAKVSLSKQEKGRTFDPAFFVFLYFWLYFHYVCCLFAFRALLDLELDILAFF